ncbi:MAG: alpha/beta hydrolase family protein, partial [Christensenellales bacterium]
EYIYDAQAAHDLIAADARIGDIYLVGHSLGAMVAPRAADALDSERIKGAALIAGTPHSLSEIALRQMRDQGMDQAQIDTLAAQFDAMNDMTDAQLQETTALGSPLWYWKDQAGDDPAARILARGLPVLILQGGKDFQVLPAEGIEAWQAALADYEGATYRYYPDMNHMLCDMAGEPTETAADYMELTGISPQLVADIAAWIHEQ